MLRKLYGILLLVAVGGLPLSTAAANGDVPFVNAALKVAQVQATESIRKWQDSSPLKLELKAFRVHRFLLAELHDPAFAFFTGYFHAPLPNVEIGVVEINSYADDVPSSNIEMAKHRIFWRVVVALRAYPGDPPEVFFSTEPFSGECGSPIIRVAPRRLLRIDNAFLFELKQEQSYHGCVGQKETVRHVAHLFKVDKRFREVFQYDELFFDGSKSTTAMLSPKTIGDDTGSSLRLQSISSPLEGPRKITFNFLKWTSDGLLVPDKNKR